MPQKPTEGSHCSSTVLHAMSRLVIAFTSGPVYRSLNVRICAQRISPSILGSKFKYANDFPKQSLGLQESPPLDRPPSRLKGLFNISQNKWGGLAPAINIPAGGPQQRLTAL